jgi:Phage tail lysozyme
VSDLPANTATVYQYFLAQLTAAGGANPAAEAAGITGNILQESGANPEAAGMGGSGLVGWTPPKAGMVTGDPTADMARQLNEIWSELTANPGPYPGGFGLTQLESQTDPVAAGETFGHDFERYGIAGNRYAYAGQVYQAAQAGQLGASATLTSKVTPGSIISGAVGGVQSLLPGAGITASPGSVVKDATDPAGILGALLAPFESWALRLLLGVVGAVLIIAALITAGEHSDPHSAAQPVPNLPQLEERSSSSPAAAAEEAL